jgi:hypothetical protein
VHPADNREVVRSNRIGPTVPYFTLFTVFVLTVVHPVISREVVRSSYIRSVLPSTGLVWRFRRPPPVENVLKPEHRDDTNHKPVCKHRPEHRR